MKKNTIERFIKKYYLNGLIDSAVWRKSSGILNVTAMTSDKKISASSTLKNYDGFADMDVGILTSKRLLALLKSIPSDDVSMDIVNRASGEAKFVTFSAEKYKVQYGTSSPSAINPIPTFKNIPPFSIAIKLTNEFIDWYLNAYAAVGDSGVLFAVEMSKQTRKLEVYLGHQDRLTFEPETLDGKNAVKERICFSARTLKEVLKANPEFKDPILNVCDAGLASISFSGEDLDSQYYLLKVDVED